MYASSFKYLDEVFSLAVRAHRTPHGFDFCLAMDRLDTIDITKIQRPAGICAGFGLIKPVGEAFTYNEGARLLDRGEKGKAQIGSLTHAGLSIRPAIQAAAKADKNFMKAFLWLIEVSGLVSPPRIEEVDPKSKADRLAWRNVLERVEDAYRIACVKKRNPKLSYAECAAQHNIRVTG